MARICQQNINCILAKHKLYKDAEFNINFRARYVGLISTSSASGGMAHIFVHILAATLLVATVTEAALETPLYLNAAAPIPARVADLISRMSVNELVAQVAHKDGGVDAAIRAEYGASSLGGVKVTLFTEGTDAVGSVRRRNAFQHFMMNTSRLGIPVSIAHEGLHSGSSYGTVFPEPLLLACSYNDSLSEAIGAVLAAEARACGVDNVWSPVLNMWTDDRFGRFQEGLSPDPTITSHMGRRIVTGIQGGASAQDDYLPGGFNTSAWATAKHYAGYGSAIGGLNGAPFVHNSRTLFEHFLRPWRAATAVGVRGVMASHNAVLDVPMHLNAHMIQDVLRTDFGFGSGMIVSDCNDIAAAIYYGASVNETHTAALAVKAGVDADLQCGNSNTSWAYYGETLPAAIKEGMITSADLQALASHYLTQKFASGLFDAPLTDESWVTRLDAPSHRQLAYEAAAQSLVLLTNNELPATGVAALPLDFGGRVKNVALIGSFMTCDGRTGANCFGRASMLGSYTLDSNTIRVDLIPQALNSTFPKQLRLSVVRGASPDSTDVSGIAAAVAAARDADVAIVAVGDSLATCGEWADRDSLDLPGGQLALLEALVANASSTPVVVVLIHGRAASFGPGNALLGKLAAVVESWRPGEMGAQAIVDVLSGRVNPSGKLASQWAQHVGQLGSGAQPWLARRVAKWVANARGTPDATDGRVYDPYVGSTYSSLPLFRFGHGLSYTSFTYTLLTIDGVGPISTLPGGGTFSGRGKAGYIDAISVTVFTAHVTVCNSGLRDGTEIVQVYSQDPRGAFPTPIVPYWKRLVAYARIPVAAGACETQGIPILGDDLALYDDVMSLRIVPGVYGITVGGRSDRDQLRVNVTLRQ